MDELYDKGHWNDNATIGNKTDYVIEHQNFNMLNDNKLAFWKCLHANYAYGFYHEQNMFISRSILKISYVCQMFFFL